MHTIRNPFIGGLSLISKHITCSLIGARLLNTAFAFTFDLPQTATHALVSGLMHLSYLSKKPSDLEQGLSISIHTLIAWFTLNKVERQSMGPAQYFSATMLGYIVMLFARLTVLTVRNNCACRRNRNSR